ncbi:MAG: hypothetical protein ACRCZI_01530, partial [Cetobacterium sp.]
AQGEVHGPFVELTWIAEMGRVKGIISGARKADPKAKAKAKRHPTKNGVAVKAVGRTTNVQPNSSMISKKKGVAAKVGGVASSKRGGTSTAIKEKVEYIPRFAWRLLSGKGGDHISFPHKILPIAIKKQTESAHMQHIRIRNNRHNNGARGNHGGRGNNGGRAVNPPPDRPHRNLLVQRGMPVHHYATNCFDYLFQDRRAQGCISVHANQIRCLDCQCLNQIMHHIRQDDNIRDPVFRDNWDDGLGSPLPGH